MARGGPVRPSVDPPFIAAPLPPDLVPAEGLADRPDLGAGGDPRRVEPDFPWPWLAQVVESIQEEPSGFVAALPPIPYPGGNHREG
jgi:hypothetical protein